MTPRFAPPGGQPVGLLLAGAVGVAEPVGVGVLEVGVTEGTAEVVGALLVGRGEGAAAFLVTAGREEAVAEVGVGV